MYRNMFLKSPDFVVLSANLYDLFTAFTSWIIALGHGVNLLNTQPWRAVYETLTHWRQSMLTFRSLTIWWVWYVYRKLLIKMNYMPSHMWMHGRILCPPKMSRYGPPRVEATNRRPLSGRGQPGGKGSHRLSPSDASHNSLILPCLTNYHCWTGYIKRV